MYNTDSRRDNLQKSAFSVHQNSTINTLQNSFVETSVNGDRRPRRECFRNVGSRFSSYSMGANGKILLHKIDFVEQNKLRAKLARRGSVATSFVPQKAPTSKFKDKYGNLAQNKH